MSVSFAAGADHLAAQLLEECLRLRRSWSVPEGDLLCVGVCAVRVDVRVLVRTEHAAGDVDPRKHALGPRVREDLGRQLSIDEPKNMLITER